MQKRIETIRGNATRTSLLHKAIACILSIMLMMSYSSIAYAFDDEASDATVTAEDISASDAVRDESAESEETTDTEEAEEVEEATSVDSEVDEAASSDAKSEKTDDLALSLSIGNTLAAISSGVEDADSVSAQTNAIQTLSSQSVGAFTVTTDQAFGTDWTYSSNVITIKSSGTYTITGDGNDHSGYRIEIANGIEVTLTLSNVKITNTSAAAMAVGSTSSNTAKVTLILEGKNSFTSTGSGYAGIRFQGATSGSLTITSDSGGSLTATGGDYGAGIGGGNGNSGNNIIITGGTVTATGGEGAAGIGGGYYGAGYDITISGGTVTATGGGGYGGAGIGGGAGGTTSSITISGGTVTATGGNGAAGIGGGYYAAGDDIKITGGTVTATGGDDAAGIGGGYRGAGSNITISGGTVTATGGGDDGAGIGGGYNKEGNNITISGGTVTATGGWWAAGIGGGFFGSGINIRIAGGNVTATTGSASVNAIGRGYGGSTATNITVSYKNGCYWRTSSSVLFTYSNDGSNVTIAGNYFEIYEAVDGFVDGHFLITGDSGGWSFTKNGSSYVISIINSGEYTISTVCSCDTEHVDYQISITSRTVDLTLNNVKITNSFFGNAAMYVASTATVTLNLEGENSIITTSYHAPGIQFQGATSGSLTITSESGTGSLTVKGADYAAGIGGRSSYEGNNITIAGGTIYAYGGYGAAGIGGGNLATGNNITISGGTVYAYGGTYAAGIGSGNFNATPTNTESASNITITGGTVYAYGGEDGAGIGGGQNASGSYITISGGTVTATGDKYAAGIGGGQYGSGTNITISGGTVKATGGYCGAGIGGGYGDDGGDGSGSNIKITGGTVTASGGTYGAGIGGGEKSKGTNITISGGTVTATGGSYAAGIGSGNRGSTGGYITISGGTVTATGGYQGAGIGGGERSEGRDIKITGGTVTATGGTRYAAGIGGGYRGAGYYIEISGGTVTATGTENAAGIGGGGSSTNLLDRGDAGIGSYITISGGIVKASGGWSGAGIGGGYRSQGFNITVSGGTVTATAGSTSANAIGSGYRGSTATGITVNCDDGYYWRVSSTADFTSSATKTISLPGGYTYVQILAGPKGGHFAVTGDNDDWSWSYNGSYHTISIISGGTYTISKNCTCDDDTEHSGYRIEIANGIEVTLTLNDVKITNSSAAAMAIGNTTDNTAKVTLILEGENSFTSTGSGYAGIRFQGATTGSLTITSMITLGSDDSLTATGGTNGAGIGGGNGGAGNNITISGGSVTAVGGDYAAGIGGGNGGAGSSITISGGTVTATGGGTIYGGAGIGGGYNGTGSSIEISGGIVEATGGWCGAGIGGGRAGSGSNITISGGTVTATGGEYAAGIGGGSGSTGSSIKISGGTVEASGGASAAGIGGGSSGSGSSITISGGTVTAAGGVITTAGLENGGAGIGGGYSASGSYITISGGTVTATGGYRSAGIGSGGSTTVTTITGSNITISGGTVTATGGDYGAGIGGGQGGAGRSITISDGTVTATGGYGAAGIGGGMWGSGANIAISGGIVEASGGEGAGIGGGYNRGGSDIKITGGIITAESDYGDAIGGGNDDYTYVSSVSVSYDNAYWWRTSASADFTSSATEVPSLPGDYSFVQLYPGLNSSFESGSISIYLNQTLNLNEYFQSTYNFDSYIWKSDSTCVTVDDGGKIEAVSIGSAIVTVTAISIERGVTTASIEIIVNKYDSTISFSERFSLDKTYDGQTVSVSKDNVTVEGSTGDISFKFEVKNSEDSWEPISGAPTDAGTYRVVACVEADASYSAASSNPLEFVIGQATPVASDFTFTALSDEVLVYDGGAKEATVEVNSEITGMGQFAVYYSLDGENWSSTTPVNAGSYLVSIAVSEGSNYIAATVSDENWEFTISKADTTISFNEGISLDKTYDGEAVSVTEDNVVVEGSGGSITFTYYVKDGGAWKELTFAPSSAASYKVVASVAGDANYNAASTELEFVISEVAEDTSNSTSSGVSVLLSNNTSDSSSDNASISEAVDNTSSSDSSSNNASIGEAVDDTSSADSSGASTSSGTLPLVVTGCLASAAAVSYGVRVLSRR